MFEDEKIRFIESMPDKDTLIVIWVKLLTLAGKSNTGGYILLTDTIPYTEEMLANQFNRPIATIRMAISLFQKLQMLETTDKGFFLTNWEKHQNVDGMERVRELTRLRVQKYRENQKQLPLGQSNVTVTDSVTPNVALGNAIEAEVEVESDIDIKNKDIDKQSSKGVQGDSPPPKVNFESYFISLKEKYTDLDYENEYEKFKLFWTEGKRKLKNPKLAWHNWLDKAREFKQRYGGNGHKRVNKENSENMKLVEEMSQHLEIK